MHEEPYFLPTFFSACLNQLDPLQLNLTDVYATGYQFHATSAVVVLVLPALAELEDPRHALQFAQPPNVNLPSCGTNSKSTPCKTRSLLEACKAKGVAVRWQGDEQLDETNWWLIDEEILEWAREVKAKALGTRDV
ncbi:hypothetical protein JCM8547_002717 [Rhodosporidiobolus lusitaniae]